MSEETKVSNIQVVNFSANDPSLLTQNVKQYSSNKIVKYGENDSQFDYLLQMYIKSTTNNAIINSTSLLIYGNGLNVEGVINPDDLRRVVRDFKIFGNFALEIVNGTIKHLPVNYIRAEEVNSDNKIENYYYSTDWKNEQNPDVLPNWELNPNAPHSIYYGRPYTPNAFYYNLPDYQGALSYCELEIEVGKFLLKTVQKSFSVTKIINFNNGIPQDETQRKQQVAQIKRQLTGSEGDPVIVAFNEDKEHAAEIQDVTVDNAADQYTYTSTESQSKILVGHGVTSPLLLGIRDTSGFSSNSDEMTEASSLYHKYRVSPSQEFIIDALEKVSGKSGLEFIDKDQAQVTETQLSEAKTELQKFIDLGSDSLEGFELFSESEVDYDLEDELDGIMFEMFEKKGTLLSKINFLSTGKASPKTKSKQDSEDYAIRYKYTGKSSKDTRPFCDAMMSADKLYRKEDIIAMEHKPVNPGWGIKGKNTYPIWTEHGGARCHHKWIRQVYLKKEISDKSRVELGQKVSVAEARRKGFRPESNDPKVGTITDIHKHKGYVTKSTMPEDARKQTGGF